MSTYHGYSESDLVANRASLLLYGGSVHDRRAWAEEAQRCFEAEGPLVTVTAAAELPAAIARPRGVVYVPDLAALSDEDQGKIVRCLQEREERPKFVLGLGESPEHALKNGRLRGDLSYRLAQAQVDLTSAELKDAIRARRQLAEAAAAKAQKVAPARGAKSAPTKAAARSVKTAPKKKVAARTPRPKSSLKSKTRGAKKR